MSPRFQRFVEQVLQPATSRAVLSWPVMAMAAGFSVLVHLIASPEFMTQPLGYRVLASTISVVPMFLVIAVVQLAPEGASRSRVPLVLLSYLVGGSVRGLALSALLNLLDPRPAGAWVYRIPSSAIFMSTTTALFAYGWAVYSSHRRSAQRLLAETQQLQAALAQLEQESQAQALQQLGQVSAGIVRDLQQLEVNPVQTQIQEIQRFIDEQVRPLSRSMAAEVKAWTPMAQPVQRLRLPSPTRNRDLLAHMPSPWWNLIQGVALVPSAYVIFGPAAALRVALAVTVTLVCVTWLWNRLARRWIGRLRTGGQVLRITAGYVVVAALGVSATYIALAGTATPAFYVPTGLVTEVTAAWVLIIGGATWAEAVEQERGLRSVHEDLLWAIARVNLLAWFNRGVITRLLHGPIQNAMHAAVMRLRGSAPSELVQGVIEELRLRIASVGSNTDTAGREPIDVEAALDDIPRLWQGIASIGIHVDGAALVALRRDAPAASIVLDLMQEVCSNSVRHGSATEISIALGAGAKVVSLRIIDNGHPLGGARTAGVGSQFMNTCTIAWQRSRNEGRNQLFATIPCLA